MTTFPCAKTFKPEAVSDETRAINAALAERLATLPPPRGLDALRESFNIGQGPIPVTPRSPSARTMMIPAADGEIVLRIVAPPTPRGVYLHLHGGGWMLGTADMWDGQLERIAAQAGLACASVEYRLTPEHPYPAAVNDCEAAARWLMDQALPMFGTDRLTIGGESAGAHLAVLTLLRLRELDRHQRFCGANLMFGAYDLSLTPSATRAERSLVVNCTALAQMSATFRGSVEARNPHVSPLYADLSGLPPALFTVGTLDPLLDDSLFMHARWLAAGNASELAVYPGGLHGFTTFKGLLATEANALADHFLAQAVYRTGTVR